jgi:predicted CoA-binding protein
MHMDISDLLAKCKTIAVVGLSKDSSKDSHMVAKYLKSNGYKIIPVNPTAYEILDEKCYRDLNEVAGEIDIVCLFRPPEEAEAIVEQAIAKKAKAVWMQLGIKNEAAAEKARQAGLEVIMDKCIMVEHKRFRELELLERTKTFLVPILTDQENDPAFLAKLKECTKLVMIFVVDKTFLNHVPAGFAGSRIQSAQDVMDDIKKKIPQNINVKDLVEWGIWYDKLENLARLENADEIIMKKGLIADELYPQLTEKGLKVTLL